MVALKKMVVVFLVLGTCGALFASACAACSVPVFRYALERWRPDAYTVVVFHKGELKGESLKAVRYLEENGAGFGVGNLKLNLVDVGKETDKEKLKALGALDDKNLPLLVAFYPTSEREGLVAWSGALNEKNAQGLIHSPLRKELAKRLMKGDTAVWIYLECGDKALDDKKVELINKALRKIEKTMKLPAPDSGEETEDAPAANTPSTEGLKIKFSLLRLSPDNPQERFMVRTLMNSEDALDEYSQKPMAFPVFGRGRLLYALVDKGVNEDNIHEAASFLTGPCQCQIKAENPGVDLLLTVDWESMILGAMVIDEAFPELTGVSVAPESESPKDAEEDISDSATLDKTPLSPPVVAKKFRFLGVALLLAVVAIVVIVGTVMMKGGK